MKPWLGENVADFGNTLSRRLLNRHFPNLSCFARLARLVIISSFMWTARASFIALLGAIFFSAATNPAAENNGLDHFEKHVRPLLVEHCYKCHSAEAEKVKGGLLLDTKAGILKGGDHGPILVPGKP